MHSISTYSRLETENFPSETLPVLKTTDFDYTLPEELIASRPLLDRTASRMMVIHRGTGLIEHRKFTDFPSLLTT